MNDDQILGILLSLWVGFTTALWMEVQSNRNKLLNEKTVVKTEFRLIIVKLIDLFVGLVGAFGVSWFFITASHNVKTSVICSPISLTIGVILFLLSKYLMKRNK